MVRPLTLSRRAFLAAGALALAAREAHALGRLPVGGTLRLSLPFGLARIDPHDLDDPLAALLGAALFEPLFALDASGATYPTLVLGPVERVGQGLGLRLRPGLRDSAGRSLDARDLEWSLQRAARGAAAGLLQPFGTPKRDPGDRERVLYPKGDAKELELALSSPAAVLLGRGFDSAKPEGTGAFRARSGPDGLRLQRNLHAARGPSYLDAIEVSRARDLTDALRRFETQEVDLGWLGRGLHRARAGSELFRSPALGWLVLHTGKRLGAWGAPGMAQRLIAAIPAQALERFGLLLASSVGGTRYAGPPAELLTRNDSAHLSELGGALVQVLVEPGSRITVRTDEPLVVRRRIAAGDFDFALEVVRSLGPTREQQAMALVTAANRSLASKPPRLPADAVGLALALRVTAATRTGVLGEFGVVGARLPAYHGLEHWDLAQVTVASASRSR